MISREDERVCMENLKSKNETTKGIMFIWSQSETQTPAKPTTFLPSQTAVLGGPSLCKFPFPLKAQLRKLSFCQTPQLLKSRFTTLKKKKKGLFSTQSHSKYAVIERSWTCPTPIPSSSFCIQSRMIYSIMGHICLVNLWVGQENRGPASFH